MCQGKYISFPLNLATDLIKTMMIYEDYYNRWRLRELKKEKERQRDGSESIDRSIAT